MTISWSFHLGLSHTNVANEDCVRVSISVNPPMKSRDQYATENKLCSHMIFNIMLRSFGNYSSLDYICLQQHDTVLKLTV